MKKSNAMSGTLIRAQLAQAPGSAPHPEERKLPKMGTCTYRLLRDGMTTGVMDVTHYRARYSDTGCPGFPEDS